MTIYTASRAEYLGHALEEEIRGRIADRRWYRSHVNAHTGDLPCRFVDMQRENVIALRGLFRARREGLRTWRDEDARIARTVAHLTADFDARYQELRELADAEGLDAVIEEAYGVKYADGHPDVPLADPGDHFLYPVAR